MPGHTEVNETYPEAFGDSRPARSVAQVAALPRGAGLEVEMIAALDTGTPQPGQRERQLTTAPREVSA